ncbi:hypothetical protein BWR17_13100 [Phaeobacter inhibens]|uniref:hypothetical protein n=1 Tax=Phaeobacter inhibens TaxID=221822 RepID=UPI000971B0AB|nr:hypothetical protein [Phaeobacter inhibens]APX16668.1 hypothetical protein BWR17_13100 [Phaeobacter inhibens]
MTKARHFTIAIAWMAIVSASSVDAQQCPHVSVNEYTDARFIFCRAHIEERLRLAYQELRYDGSEQMLSFEDAEGFILQMNALARGDTGDVEQLLSSDPKLRSMLRGLIAGEVFTKRSVERYCRYKFPDNGNPGLALPSFSDPERVRNIDFFLGCLE